MKPTTLPEELTAGIITFVQCPWVPRPVRKYWRDFQRQVNPITYNLLALWVKRRHRRNKWVSGLTRSLA